MSFTTFSGPVRSGTQRFGGITVCNAGLVMLTQTAVIPATAILTAPAAVALFTLPAGSKILRFRVEVIVALTTATNCALTIGTAGTANLYATTFNTGATSNVTTQATVDAAMVVAQTDNIGTTDVTLYATPTAATGNAAAGSISITVQYIQRTSAGVAYPAGTAY
jgi:hypothetical protein